jgi:hypothetical protein
VCSNVYQSPNGTRYWTPNVPLDLKPNVGSVYENWESVLSMYNTYAEEAGFCTRLGALKRVQGVITHRYILCSKAGKPKGQVIDTTDVNEKSPVRRSKFKVTDCKARIRLKAIKGTESFMLYDFVEAHNHGLVSKDNLDLTRKKRKLTFSDQEFIARCRLANIGPSRAHRLQVALKGGHHMVRGTKTDYKNFQRDINTFIGSRDAQMFVETLNQRSLNLVNYTFKYYAIDREVRCFFWVDDVAKTNYTVFGDLLAFDATYQTNKQVLLISFLFIFHLFLIITCIIIIIFNLIGTI